MNDKDQFEEVEVRDDIEIDPEEPTLKVRAVFVHGQNLEQKGCHKAKYRDAKSKELLAEVRVQYDVWKEANAQLKGPHNEPKEDEFAVIQQRVKLFSDYKDFIDRQDIAECFDSRSNLKLMFQVQHPAPAGHRMLRWTNDTSISTARNVA